MFIESGNGTSKKLAKKHAALKIIERLRDLAIEKENPEEDPARLANSPEVAGSQQQMATMLPQLLQQLMNPSVQQLLANSEALEVSYMDFKSYLQS